MGFDGLRFRVFRASDLANLGSLGLRESRVEGLGLRMWACIDLEQRLYPFASLASCDGTHPVVAHPWPKPQHPRPSTLDPDPEFDMVFVY